jgi:hypothetical protein
MVERLDDSVGITQLRQGPPHRAETLGVFSRWSDTYLVEDFRQRFNLLDALTTFVHIVVVAMVLKKSF